MGVDQQAWLTLLESIVGNTRDAILATEAWPIAEPGPRIIYANESFTRMTGYTFEELAGKTPRVLQGPKTDRAKLDEIRAALTEQKPVRVELINYHKDGTEFWVETDIAPVIDEQGNHTHWIFVQRDITERRKQEEALRESEERLRTVIIQYASDIITILEPNGIIRYESPAVERVLGYRPEELSDKNIFDYVHPEDVERTVTELGRVREEPGVRGPVEVRFQHKDGSWRYLEVIGNNVLEDPAVDGVVINSRDVTRRKEVEEKLQESRDLLQAVMDGTTDAVYVKDTQGRYLMINPAGADMLGKTVEEVIGKNDADLFTPEDGRQVMAVDREIMETQETQSYEENKEAEDDVGRTYLTTRGPYWDRRGELVGVFGVSRDISKRKEKEARLEEAEQRFRQLFEQSVDAIYVHDEEGRFVDCNPQACRLLGYSREELLNMSVRDVSRNVLTPEERAQQEREGGTLWRRALAGEPGALSRAHEEENIRKDGTTFPVEVRVGSVDYGGRRMVLASVRDVTRRKESENALVRQKEYLSALNETTVGLMDRLDTEDLLESILGRAGALLGTPHGFFSLLTPDEEALELRAGTGLFADLVGDRIDPDVGLSGRVIQTGEPVAVSDYSSWPGRRTDVDGPAYAILGVPLRSGAKVVGVISVANLREGYAFGPDEEEVLSRFAELASVALDNAKLYSVAKQELAERERAEEKQRRRARELALLHDVRSAISLELKPEGVCYAAVEAVAGSYGYALVSTYLVDNEELVMQHQIGFHNYHEVLDRIPAGHGVMWRTVWSGEPVLLEDAHADPDFIAAVQGIVSEICVPLFDEGRSVGVLNVESTEGTPLDKDDLRLLKEVGEHIGVALERARLYARAKEAEERFRGAFEYASTGVALVDLDGHPFRANRALQEMLGYSEEEIFERGVSGLTHPDDLRKTEERNERLLDDDGPDTMSMEKRYICRDGQVVWTISDVSLVRGAAGEPSHFVCQFQNITGRKRAEEALKKSEERFRSLVQNASDLITVVDAGGIITYESPSKERILGYGPQELVGRPVLEHVHPDDLEHVSAEFVNVVSRTGYRSERPVEFRYRHADGTWRYLESIAANLLDDPGVGSVVITSRDVTERKELEEQLFYQAFHDPLTGLPNRSSLQRDFEQATSHPTTRVYDCEDPPGGPRDGTLYVGVLFLDLDGFKRVNDSMGHETGDKLLRAVAERLKGRMRVGDSVARLGGDEFCVLLAGISSSAEAVQIAERLRASLEAPFSVPTGASTGDIGNNTLQVSLSASIGIAVGKLDDDHSLDELLREADAAMYRTKTRGGDLYEIVKLKENTG